MSSRERWTVYPLLFMTLGIALRDKVTGELDTRRVSCRELVVTDQAGRRQVVLEANNVGGAVRTYNATPGVNVTLGHFSLQNFNQAAGVLLTDRAGNMLLGSTLVPALLQVRPNPRRETQPQEEEPAPKEKAEQKADESPDAPTPADQTNPPQGEKNSDGDDAGSTSNGR